MICFEPFLACFSDENSTFLTLSFHSIYQNVPFSVNFSHLSQIIRMHSGLSTSSYFTSFIIKHPVYIIFILDNSTKLSILNHYVFPQLMERFGIYMSITCNQYPHEFWGYYIVFSLMFLNNKNVRFMGLKLKKNLKGGF